MICAPQSTGSCRSSRWCRRGREGGRESDVHRQRDMTPRDNIMRVAKCDVKAVSTGGMHEVPWKIEVALGNYWNIFWFFVVNLKHRSTQILYQSNNYVSKLINKPVLVVACGSKDNKTFSKLTQFTLSLVNKGQTIRDSSQNFQKYKGQRLLWVRNQGTNKYNFEVMTWRRHINPSNKQHP